MVAAIREVVQIAVAGAEQLGNRLRRAGSFELGPTEA
jgi:hypothetical protein